MTTPLSPAALFNGARSPGPTQVRHLAEFAASGALRNEHPVWVRPPMPAPGQVIASDACERPECITANGVFVAAAHDRQVDVRHGADLKVHRSFEFSEAVTEVALQEGFALLAARDCRLSARSLTGSRQVVTEWADGGTFVADAPILAVRAIGNRTAVLTEGGLTVLDPTGMIEREVACESGPTSQWGDSIAIAADDHVTVVDVRSGVRRDIGLSGAAPELVALSEDHLYIAVTREGRCSIERYGRRSMMLEGSHAVPRAPRLLAATYGEAVAVVGADIHRLPHELAPRPCALRFTIKPNDAPAYGGDAIEGIHIRREGPGHWIARIPPVAAGSMVTVHPGVVDRVTNARGVLKGDEVHVETTDCDNWGVDCTAHVAVGSRPVLVARGGGQIHASVLGRPPQHDTSSTLPTIGLQGPACADVAAIYGYDGSHLVALSLSPKPFQAIPDFENGQGPGVPALVI